MRDVLSGYTWRICVAVCSFWSAAPGGGGAPGQKWDQSNNIKKRGQNIKIPLKYRGQNTKIPLKYRGQNTKIPLKYRGQNTKIPIKYRGQNAKIPLKYRGQNTRSKALNYIYRALGRGLAVLRSKALEERALCRGLAVFRSKALEERALGRGLAVFRSKALEERALGGSCMLSPLVYLFSVLGVPVAPIYSLIKGGVSTIAIIFPCPTSPHDAPRPQG